MVIVVVSADVSVVIWCSVIVTVEVIVSVDDVWVGAIVVLLQLFDSAIILIVIIMD